MGRSQFVVCYVRMHGTAPAHFYFDPKVVDDKVGFGLALNVQKETFNEESKNSTM